MREQLRALLPEYMVPHALHWREKLPLTGNGKIDRKALLALAGELELATNRGRPATATEKRLATAWSEVLDLPKDEIDRGASFFDLGGTSLSAIRLATRLGRAISLKDLNDHPVLADLAALIDRRLEQSTATEAVR